MPEDIMANVIDANAEKWNDGKPITSLPSSL
jgi:hypothetical protein